jgi:hypothetical protein
MKITANTARKREGRRKMEEGKKAKGRDLSLPFCPFPFAFSSAYFTSIILRTSVFCSVTRR